MARWADICGAYLKGQQYLGPLGKEKAFKTDLPFITLSRQTGAGGLTVAKKLGQFLQENNREDDPPWCVFDKNLVQKVIEEHNLPDRFRTFLKENQISEIQDILEELFGVHPSKWTLAHKMAETIF